MVEKQTKSSRIYGPLAISCSLILIAAPFVFFCSNLLRDWYRESMLSTPCFHLFSLTRAQDGGVIVRSTMCTETTNTYSRVTAWYTQRGWYCDGACEFGKSVTLIGSIHFDVYKRMMPIDQDFQRSPLEILLYEEYALVIY